MHLVASYVNKSGKEYGIYSDMGHILAKKLKSRIANKYQNIVMINGTPGKGKSTLGIQLAREMDPSWDMREGYCYFKDEVLKFLTDPHIKIGLIDETTNVLNALDYRNKDDNMAVVLFDTMRSFGRTAFMCTPNFRAVNKRVRDEHTNFLIALPEKPLLKGYSDRGFYELYVPVKDTFSEEPFWKLAGAGLYGALDPDTEEEYAALKREKQLKKNEMVRRMLAESEKKNRQGDDEE